MKNINYILLFILSFFFTSIFLSNYKLLIVDKTKFFSLTGTSTAHSIESYHFESFNYFSNFSVNHHSKKTRLFNESGKKYFFSDMKNRLGSKLLNSNSKHYLESKALLDNIISDFTNHDNFKNEFLISVNSLRYTFVLVNKNNIEKNIDVLNTYFFLESLDSLLRVSDCFKIYRKFNKIFLENCYIDNLFFFVNEDQPEVPSDILDKEPIVRGAHLYSRLQDQIKYEFFYIDDLGNIVSLFNKIPIIYIYQIFIIILILCISFISIIKILFRKI